MKDSNCQDSFTVKARRANEPNKKDRPRELERHKFKDRSPARATLQTTYPAPGTSRS